MNNFENFSASDDSQELNPEQTEDLVAQEHLEFADDIEGVTEEARDRLNDQIEGFEDDLEGYNEEIAELQEQIADLQTEIDASTERWESYGSLLTGFDLSYVTNADDINAAFEYEIHYNSNTEQRFNAARYLTEWIYLLSKRTEMEMLNAQLDYLQEQVDRTNGAIEQAQAYLNGGERFTGRPETTEPDLDSYRDRIERLESRYADAMLILQQTRDAHQEYIDSGSPEPPPPSPRPRPPSSSGGFGVTPLGGPDE